jgi:DNA topoisomerase-2
MNNIKSSAYIDDQRRQYSLYVMQHRAIPAITDGLKAGGRRALWTARDGHKWKTATLAGASLPIHPHGLPDGAINTLAAPYGNNVPYFKGDGAFGTLLDPTAYGAARYTAVTTSEFTQDVLFRDIEIIPMQDNYDSTLQEPVHFLPLVPTVMLNPAEGIAVGFATNILPRELTDVITVQLAHLTGKKLPMQLMPAFVPLGNVSHHSEVITATGRTAYYFNGEYEQLTATTIRITRLPYGMSHKQIEKNIAKLHDTGDLLDSTDASKKTIDITLKFKKGVISSMTHDEILEMLGLSNRQTGD